MANRVYADTDAGRLGAQLQDGIVHVWQAGHGSQLGGYRIERFEGGKLTASTLRKLFELPEPETFDAEGEPIEPVAFHDYESDNLVVMSDGSLRDYFTLEGNE